MRIFKISLVLLTAFLSASLSAADLYEVRLHNEREAQLLTSAGVEPILRISGGFLVLADSASSAAMEAGGLEMRLLAEDVEKSRLALDNRPDEVNAKKFRTVFELDGLRLFLLDGAESMVLSDGSSLIPIRNEYLKISYHHPKILTRPLMVDHIELDSLIKRISLDSCRSYVEQLQAFDGRVAGTLSNYASRDWLRNKLVTFGYVDAHTESFYAYVYGSWVNCYNVVATKTGTVFPGRQIVVGAHFDAVPGSPGADDNASGTAGVLEIARALAGLTTDMTFKFILFDSEEQGLNGAFNYAGEAAAWGDSILCMLNMDMIGHYDNGFYANALHGVETGYADLWCELSKPLVNVTGVIAGQSSRSDHYAFDQNGYDVVFAQEYNFSTVYHTYRDSTSLMNFGYMTDLVQVTLATGYVVDQAPPPVAITSVRDAGDGQSLQVNWVPGNPAEIDSYRIYYDTNPTTGEHYIDVSGDLSQWLITGLTEGQEYSIWVHAFNSDGKRSILAEVLEGTPYYLPQKPFLVEARPGFRSIRLTWIADNNELDFSHYDLIRDGMVLNKIITGTSYEDDDFALGDGYHDYLVVAIDDGGNLSDMTGEEPVRCRVATLTPGKILAVNRSSMLENYLVNEVVTGEFLRQALTPFNYDYLSDTAYSFSNKPDTLKLDGMIGYEIVVFGAEACRTDQLGGSLSAGGILPDIDYYLSIGGKVVIFGRWGDIKSGSAQTKTITYSPGAVNYAYTSRFFINSRVQILSAFDATMFYSDFIGAKSQAAGYPPLVWDSLAAVNHTAPWTQVQGIPCPSYVNLNSNPNIEILYRYDSRNNYPSTEDKVIAWKYTGPGEYVFFEFPLSFFDRATAVTALQAAVSGMISAGPAGQTVILPDTVDANEGTPENVHIYLGDFGGGMTAGDIDQNEININGSVIPGGVSILPSHPDFGGEVLEIAADEDGFVDSYGWLVDTATYGYIVSWKFTGQAEVKSAYGYVTIIGRPYIDGDANSDGAVNVGDAVWIINYAFKGGAAPEPLEAGDANCDGSVNVGDAVYLINYAFKGGPIPGCE